MSRPYNDCEPYARCRAKSDSAAILLLSKAVTLTRRTKPSAITAIFRKPSIGSRQLTVTAETL